MTKALVDSEMRIDEEGIPRFTPDGALVGGYLNLLLQYVFVNAPTYNRLQVRSVKPGRSQYHHTA